MQEETWMNNVDTEGRAYLTSEFGTFHGKAQLPSRSAKKQKPIFFLKKKRVFFSLGFVGFF